MDQSELRWLTPAMTQALPVIQQVFEQYAPAGFVVEFTSGKEWVHHKMLSLDHSGNALDIRTRTLPDGGLGGISAYITTVLQQALDAHLGSGQYRVLLNDAGPLIPHIHVQYNPGGRWSETWGPVEHGVTLCSMLRF
jgi:hypothetical protein